MKYSELQDMFWTMTAKILKGRVAEENIRLSYPEQGAPDWKITDNVIFLNLRIKDDDFSKQNDSVYVEEGNTIKRYRSRTRVWELMITAYGDEACDNQQKIMDSVFTEEIKTFLKKYAVFLIPDMPTPIQANEIFAGQWWQRWDLVLHFNELHMTEIEDVGRFEMVRVQTQVNRR